MSQSVDSPRNVVVLAPGEGRAYPMGCIAAVLKADGEDTESRYSISEWWLEPNTQGPGVHAHPEFEQYMPGIVEWFAEHPPGNAG